MSLGGTSPRVRGNDWSVLHAPEPDAHVPARSVSVVIPAYRAMDTLPYTLAALQAQTYPASLLEVVVVDDDDGPVLELPEIRPENTRVVDASGSWGPGNARHAGATVADGDVVHWLDSDMVPVRDHVASHMRWHHVSDHSVVLGHKLFVDATSMPSVEKVHEAVLDDRLEDVFVGRWVDEHRWVEEIWSRTEDLRSAGFRAFHVHVGATASVGRDLYADAGGMDATLKLGEDVELGYRLAMRGAVFVAERRASSWHLGRSNLMRHEQLVQRHNAPFVAQRVPDFRKFRQERGRTYRVPYVEVVVEAEGHSWEQVKYTVDGVLQAQPADIQCLLVGPWSGLDDVRRHPLQDPSLDLRLLREEYCSDPRVDMVEAIGRTAFPAQFRLHLPVGWRPGVDTLERLTDEMQRRAQGLRSLLLSDGRVVRLERTAAFERALRVAEDGEELDDVVDAVSETWWSAGEEKGFRQGPEPAEVAVQTESPLAAAQPSAAHAQGTPPSTNGVTQHGARLSRLRSLLGMH